VVLVKEIVRRVRSLRRKDDGATAVEYGLLVALIAVVLAAGAWALGNALQDRFNESAACVNTPAAECNPAG
jgi:pilus assembly protein Flp/PilA